MALVNPVVAPLAVVTTVIEARPPSPVVVLGPAGTVTLAVALT